MRAERDPILRREWLKKEEEGRRKGNGEGREGREGREERGRRGGKRGEKDNGMI